MKILFFGSDDFAIPSLKTLHASHTIVGVITQPDKPAGRGQKVKSCPAATIAKELGLKLIQPIKLQNEEATQQLLALKPDCLVVVAYGKFLPKKLINMTPFKAVNLHPSLLPKYRGAAPIQWAILNGDKKTGVTTMTVSEEMGANLLLKTLDELEKGSLKAKPQDSKKVILAPKLTKENGHLNWQEPAKTLYNKIRAMEPWPGTFCRFNNKILKIFQVNIVKNETPAKPGTIINAENGITVACGQDALSLLEVQLEGKKRMKVSDFLKGHPIEAGVLLT